MQVTANGSPRADVRVGESVQLQVHAEVPAGTGNVRVKWDFDGSGTFPFAHSLDGTSDEVELSTTHSFDRPGSYFATAMVESHRDGDVNATCRRVPNPASTRVVVT